MVGHPLNQKNTRMSVFGAQIEGTLSILQTKRKQVFGAQIEIPLSILQQNENNFKLYASLFPLVCVIQL